MRNMKFVNRAYRMQRLAELQLEAAELREAKILERVSHPDGSQTKRERPETQQERTERLLRECWRVEA